MYPSSVSLEDYRWQLHADIAPGPMQDINFDGYLDIVATRGAFGTRLFRYFHGWVWNPQTNLFDNTNYGDICGVSLLPERQVVRGHWHDAMGAYEEVYRFIDGELVLTNTLKLSYHTPWGVTESTMDKLLFNYYLGEGGNPVCLTENKLVNGEWVPAWPIICDTEEGLATMREHLFGEDSIWFPARQPAEEIESGIHAPPHT